MTRQKIAAALRAAGFQSAGYDSGYALVPCTTGRCVDFLWIDGQQVRSPKGDHSHRVKVRSTVARSGFRLIENADGSITVRGIDPLEVSRRLTSRGFDVVLKEHHGWQVWSPTIQYLPAVVVGMQAVR